MQRVFGPVNVVSLSSHYTKKEKKQKQQNPQTQIRKNIFQDNGADRGLV